MSKINKFNIYVKRILPGYMDMGEGKIKLTFTINGEARESTLLVDFKDGNIEEKIEEHLEDHLISTFWGGWRPPIPIKELYNIDYSPRACHDIGFIDYRWRERNNNLSFGINMISQLPELNPEPKLFLGIMNIKCCHDDRIIFDIGHAGNDIKVNCGINDIFNFIKSAAAELVTENWKEAGRIYRLTPKEFGEEFYIQISMDGEYYNVNNLSAYPPYMKLLEVIGETVDNTTIVNDNNLITALIDNMEDINYSNDIEKQGVSDITGWAWGVRFSFRRMHVLGNWLIEGYLHDLFIRIARSNGTARIYISSPGKPLRSDPVAQHAWENQYDLIGLRSKIKSLALSRVGK